MEKKNRLLYSKASYSSAEIRSVNNVLLNQSLNLVNSNKCRDLEKKISIIFGYKYACLVNSGSTANEMAIQSLNLPEGSEVLTPSLTFATTVSPILKNNLTPKLLDVELDTMNINAELIEKNITKKTRALMIPNLIGNYPNWELIYKLKKKYNLKVIEDSADTIGGKHFKNKNSFSDVVTSSFYGSHMITLAGIGGVVLTNSAQLYRKHCLLREWGRRSSLLKNDRVSERFKYKLDNKLKYDQMFAFEELGSNYLLPEICAAFGIEQIKKLTKFKKIRQRNFLTFLKYIEPLNNIFVFPNEKYSNDVVWLSFPIIFKKDDPNLRLNFQIYLEKFNIQTRPLFAGNISKQPGYKKFFTKKNYKFSDHIMRNGVLLGLHQSVTKSNILYIFSIINKFIKINNI